MAKRRRYKRYYRRGRKSSRSLTALVPTFLVGYLLLMVVATAERYSEVIGGIVTLIIIVPLFYYLSKAFTRFVKNHRYVISNIEDVDCLNGHEFEHFLAPLFEKYGYKAEVTKGSGEFGADLILHKKGVKSIVQAKCYGENKKVGVKAIQEVVGALALYKAKKGIVITNRYFTNQAKQLAIANNVRLIDRNQLAEMLYECNKRT
jgi:restriction system protein